MEKRFESIYTEGFFGMTEVIVDHATGVCYLWHHDGHAGGLTPLLDADGKPVIDKDLITQ